MCWSKHSPDTEDVTPTTTLKPMASNLKCPDSAVPCVGEAQNVYCSDGNGLCCHHIDANRMSCVCKEEWTGKFCQNRNDYEFSIDDYRKTQAIVAFSAILGVIVIALFIALVILQIKYYRRRKMLHRKLISRTDTCEHSNDVKKRLTIQPGYSWRESVRRTHSKATQKLKNTLSRSVPEDLYQVGLKLAFLGGWKPNHGPIDQQSAAVKAEVKAETTQRCFSSGPDQHDSGDRPIVVQMSTIASAEEDTVK